MLTPMLPILGVISWEGYGYINTIALVNIPVSQNFMIDDLSQQIDTLVVSCHGTIANPNPNPNPNTNSDLRCGLVMMLNNFTVIGMMILKQLGSILPLFLQGKGNPIRKQGSVEFRRHPLREVTSFLAVNS